MIRVFFQIPGKFVFTCLLVFTYRLILSLTFFQKLFKLPFILKLPIFSPVFFDLIFIDFAPLLCRQCCYNSRPSTLNFPWIFHEFSYFCSHFCSYPFEFFLFIYFCSLCLIPLLSTLHYSLLPLIPAKSLFNHPLSLSSIYVFLPFFSCKLSDLAKKNPTFGLQLLHGSIFSSRILISIIFMNIFNFSK